MSAIFAVLVTAGLAPTAVAADAENRPALRVEIRSTVDDLWNGMKKKKPEPHGKIFYIISMRAEKSEQKLKAPVDEDALAKELKRALNAQGFREISGGEKPDILLAVIYGRGLLKNPYLQDGLDEIDPEGPIATISSPGQGFARHENGFEAKAQNAQNEKLYVTVRAVKYPDKPREKVSRLWQTTVILADPDNHDLNEVAKDMFAVGVTQFDRVLPKEGVVISTDDPQGKVILRPLKVIEEEKSGSAAKK